LASPIWSHSRDFFVANHSLFNTYSFTITAELGGTSVPFVSFIHIYICTFVGQSGGNASSYPAPVIVGTNHDSYS